MDVLYGLPWIAQPVVVYYNKDCSMPPVLAYPTADWTWDDFIDDGEALTQGYRRRRQGRPVGHDLQRLAARRKCSSGRRAAT